MAARAPSGTNTQPWKVHVLTGEAQGGAVARDPRRLRRPAERAPAQRGVRLLPDRVGVALHRPPPQGRLGPVRAARHRQDRQGAHACAARAATTEFFDAPVGLMFTIDRMLRAGQLARLRHVPAERDGRRARPRARHLPAGGVHAVPPHHQRAHRRAGERDAGVRHVARPCRPGAIENALVDRARAGAAASRASSNERRKRRPIHATAKGPNREAAVLVAEPCFPTSSSACASTSTSKTTTRDDVWPPAELVAAPAGQGRRLHHRQRADRCRAARRLPAAQGGVQHGGRLQQHRRRRPAPRTAWSSATRPTC